MLKTRTKSKDIDEKLRRDIGTILRRLCEYKGVEIIEAKACIDHIYASKNTT